MKNSLKILIGAASAGAAFYFYNSYSTGIPNGVKPVQNFDLAKYLGKWYEIARFDFRFEKNLNKVTATYSKNADGSVKVDNKVFNYKKNEWEQSTGEAKFAAAKTDARFKVTFFKPIWSSYIVFDLVDYKYALVSGNTTEYLWILSHEKTIPDYVNQRFLEKAEALKFPVQKLIWVEHDENSEY